MNGIASCMEEGKSSIILKDPIQHVNGLLCYKL